MREGDRCAALSEEFGVQVRVPLCCRRRSSTDDIPQISPDQLVQSHTPLRNMVDEYRSKPVLVIGGDGENGRAIAES